MGVIFYLIVFSAIFLLCAIGTKYYKKDKKKGKYFIFLSILLLTMFVGLRCNVGTDYNSYLRIHNIIKNTSWDNLFQIDMELGALIVFKITSSIFKNQYMLFIVIGFLTIIPLYIANKELDYNYLAYSILAYCTLFLPFCLNGMRQGIAMSFIFLSFVLAYKQKSKKAYICLLAAFLFHKSAFLFLPFEIIYIFLDKKKYPKYITVLTIILSVIILFFLKDFLQFEELQEYSYMIKKVKTEHISYNSLIFYFPVILISYIFKNKTELFENSNALFINGIILYIVGTSAKFFYRISLYFTLFQILSIPMVIQNIKKRNTRFIVKAIYIVYLFTYFIVQSYIFGKHDIIPYSTWLLK